MNSTVIPMPLPAMPAKRRFRWRRLFLGVFCAGFLLFLILALSFLPGGEVRAIREIALKSAPGTWERQVEFGIGRIPVWLAKAGLSFANLEPGVRAGVSAFQFGDVAVFERAGGKKEGESTAAETLDKVRNEMERRGWETVVQVQETDEVVGVFMPRTAAGGSTVQACVFVLDGSDMVIVSARANLAPIMDFALAHDPMKRWAKR